MCEKERVEQTHAGRTKGAKIRQENNNKNGIKGIKRRIWEMRNRIRGERGERSEGLSENVIVNADPPIKTNSYSRQGLIAACLSHEVINTFMVRVSK